MIDCYKGNLDNSDPLIKHEDIYVINRYEVVRDNWYNLLDPQIAEDLRSRRTYNERSVSGLLRALRNKKHHYQVILLINMVVLFQLK